MMVSALEVLVEEPSMGAALEVLLPQIAPGVSFEVRRFNGKLDLLRKLPNRLRGYASRVTATGTAIIVVVDRDSDDCHELKDHLDRMAQDAGLSCTSASGSVDGLVLNRIAIEELEAWFLGDPPALAKAYPGVPITLGSRRGFRDPDDIAGTWEALERVLQRAGHHKGGLAKIRAARDIATHMSIEINMSKSFTAFRDGVRFVTRGSEVA
jgi:hypothetical protein